MRARLALPAAVVGLPAEAAIFDAGELKGAGPLEVDGGAGEAAGDHVYLGSRLLIAMVWMRGRREMKMRCCEERNMRRVTQRRDLRALEDAVFAPR